MRFSSCSNVFESSREFVSIMNFQFSRWFDSSIVQFELSCCIETHTHTHTMHQLMIHEFQLLLLGNELQIYSFFSYSYRYEDLT